MKHKRVLIADDHFAIRRGVRHILETKFQNLEFGEAVNSAEALHKLKLAPWDILILDIEVPGRSGFEVLKQIKSERIKTPVLVFSFHKEDQIAIRALKSGAAGYLSKDAADTELVDAIEQILAGKKYISVSVAQQLAAQLDSPMDQDPHDALSDREYQTLLLIASGRTVSEISAELSLSISTISTYRARILEKMGMKTNAELTSYAIRRNLV
ncbi:MAG TPA: response regulator transcription factor [Sphingobacteriaceae bacterium]